MFGEKKNAREHGGQRATATVIAIKKLIGSHPTSSRYAVRQWLKLRVEPEGEPSFEAEISVKSSNKSYEADGGRGRLEPLREIAPGFTTGKLSWEDLTTDRYQPEQIPVLFDPADHAKVALDESPETEAHRLAPSRADVHAQFQELKAAHRGEAGLVGQPPAAVDPADRQMARLERLAALHERGALTDEEFTEQKARLLDG